MAHLRKLSVSKLELRKTLKEFYSSPAGEVVLVRMPKMKYIMVDGEGEPAGGTFQQAMGVLYNVAYTLKFRARKLLKRDYDMMAPEGLWWFKGKTFDMTKKDEWLWTLMIIVPDFISEKMFSESIAEVRRKKNLPGLEKARLQSFGEGLCVQMMHVGPYASELESIAKMEAYARVHGYKLVGKHHEVYLGDPRRSAPSKLRTILRHPVENVP